MVLTHEQLQQEVQNTTGKTWFNAHLYISYSGWLGMAKKSRAAVDELREIAEAHRERGEYEAADRLRGVIATLERGLDYIGQ